MGVWPRGRRRGRFQSGAARVLATLSLPTWEGGFIGSHSASLWGAHDSHVERLP